MYVRTLLQHTMIVKNYCTQRVRNSCSVKFCSVCKESFDAFTCDNGSEKGNGVNENEPTCEPLPVNMV